MILVSMRKNKATHHGGVLLEIAKVGSDNVHAKKFGIRKHHSGIDNNNVVAVAKGHRIHSELAKSAERDDLEFAISHTITKLKLTMQRRIRRAWRADGCAAYYRRSRSLTA